jgi:hypothetical protein
MPDQPRDIYTEPDADPDTLKHLGPLRRLAGIWQGTKSLDVNPGPGGTRRQDYVEHIELQPIDPQTNGPQLFYGLSYVMRAVKPGEVETYHHQVGHWLWEPATGRIIQTLSIPRGQTALAMGTTTADATRFTLVAERGSTVNGICSNPFLEEAFRTDRYEITVTLDPDGTWRYDEVTILQVAGRPAPFQHTDGNRLHKVGDPTPNPLMRR